MGKFTGVLIASDFDNTLVYTENALKGLEPMPDLLPENRAAIEYFMAEASSPWPPAAPCPPLRWCGGTCP